MHAVRVDERLRITWLSDGERALGRLRLGARTGEAGLVPLPDLVRAARYVRRAMARGIAEHFMSPLGMMLVVPVSGGAVIYLDPQRLDLGGEADDLRADGDQLLEDVGDTV